MWWYRTLEMNNLASKCKKWLIAWLCCQECFYKSSKGREETIDLSLRTQQSSYTVASESSDWRILTVQRRISGVAVTCKLRPLDDHRYHYYADEGHRQVNTPFHLHKFQHKIIIYLQTIEYCQRCVWVASRNKNFPNPWNRFASYHKMAKWLETFTKLATDDNFNYK